MMSFCWSSLRINASSLSESSKEVDLTFLKSRTDSFGATENKTRGISHSKGAISFHGFWKMLTAISKSVIQFGS
ncbi:hypothetical protein C4D60_Mb08t11730 [Musa balbisiana]|uniref:Uncharacterized protein n=1 Tax=Musa balbisiana TaxID=52838 RepID=A0A4S8K329_MUSBA|nr:hypothetical protein C4D60_Mb08t11730 [Musa balbisiana]